MFEGKTLMITGGTGSFGHAVLNRFLNKRNLFKSLAYLIYIKSTNQITIAIVD